MLSLRRAASGAAILSAINYWRAHRRPEQTILSSIKHVILRFVVSILFNVLVHHYRRTIKYSTERYPLSRPSAEAMALDRLMFIVPTGSPVSQQKLDFVFLPVWRFLMNEVQPSFLMTQTTPINTRRSTAEPLYRCSRFCRP